MNGSRIHWCQDCNVPLISDTCEICEKVGSPSLPDLKPIFPEEQDFLNSETDEKYSLTGQYNYFRYKNRIVRNGKALLTFHVCENGLVAEKNNIENSNCKQKATPFEHILLANKRHLEKIESEAIKFIKETVDTHSNKDVIVSFSGGKDSAATAFLVKKALGETPLLFSNTTVEFPETLKFAKDFENKVGFDLVVLNPANDFMTMCKELGPPSRMMRWCCFTQKSAPINAFYAKLNKQFLTFGGIRKSESISREKLGRSHKNTKIIRQHSAYPIFNWSDLEVWLYTLYRKIPINPLYFKGYGRIGCWACPNNGKFDEFLMSRTHPMLSKNWLNYLLNYAASKGKTPTWVFLGKWKQRTAKYEKFEICSYQNICTRGSKFLFNLKNEVFSENILEFFKVFGRKKVESVGDEKLVQIVGPKVIIASIAGSKTMRVRFTDMNCFNRSLFEIRKQLEKAVNCINCGACVGSCQLGAIEWKGKIIINEAICVNCS